MSYPELQKLLHDNHLYPIVHVRKTKQGDVIEGFQINVSPLLKDDLISRLRDIVGEWCKVDYLGNDNEYILIKLKDGSN